MLFWEEDLDYFETIISKLEWNSAAYSHIFL